MFKLTSCLAGIWHQGKSAIVINNYKSAAFFKKEFLRIPSSYVVRKPPWRVLFFGTDDFSIPSLKLLFKEVLTSLIRQENWAPMTVFSSRNTEKARLESIPEISTRNTENAIYIITQPSIFDAVFMQLLSKCIFYFYLCSSKDGGLIKRLGVVTSLKVKKNSVRDFADFHELPMFGWPFYSFPGDFDVGFIASFGHLIPEHIIRGFPLGMLNVHASLLPRWRGAAPIIYAILNGDTETGVTIMQVKPHKFDIGNIVIQESCPIYPTDTGLELKSRLAEIGANLLFDTLEQLPNCLLNTVPQPRSGITYGMLKSELAPRVNSSLSNVDWQKMSSIQVFNLHRALVGLYPLSTSWHGLSIKLLGPVLLDEKLSVSERTSNSWLLNSPGCVELDRSERILRVLCADNKWIGFQVVRIQGRKSMTAQDFYNGFVSKRSATEWMFK